MLPAAGNGVPAVPQYTFLVNGDPDLNPVYWSSSNTSLTEPAGVSNICGPPLKHSSP